MISKETIQLIFTAKDNTKSAFKTMTSGLDRVRKAATKAVAEFAKLGSKKLLGGLRSIGSAIGSIAGVGSLASIGGLTAAFGLLAKQGLAAGDELAKVGDKLGITTEGLGRLKFAVSQTSDVTERGFNVALQRMVRRIADANDGNKGLSETFAQLGLDAEQLAKDGPEKSFLQISEAISRLNDQSKKVLLTFKIFDTEGVGLVNTLNKGEAAISALGARADELGLTFSRVDTAKIEAANDSLGRVRSVISSLGIAIAVEVAPKIEELTQRVLDWIAANGGIAQIVERTFDVVVEKVKLAAAAIKDLADFAGIDFDVTGTEKLEKQSKEIEELTKNIKDFEALIAQAQPETISTGDALLDAILPGDTQDRIDGYQKTIDAWIAEREELRQKLNSNQIVVNNTDLVGDIDLDAIKANVLDGIGSLELPDVELELNTSLNTDIGETVEAYNESVAQLDALETNQTRVIDIATDLRSNFPEVAEVLKEQQGELVEVLASYDSNVVQLKPTIIEIDEQKLESAKVGLDAYNALIEQAKNASSDDIGIDYAVNIDTQIDTSALDDLDILAEDRVIESTVDVKTTLTTDIPETIREIENQQAQLVRPGYSAAISNVVDLKTEINSDTDEVIAESERQTQAIVAAIDKQEDTISSKLASAGRSISSGLGNLFSFGSSDDIELPELKIPDNYSGAIELPELVVPDSYTSPIEIAPELDSQNVLNKISELQDAFESFDISNPNAEIVSLQSKMSLLTLVSKTLALNIKKASDAGKDFDFSSAQTAADAGIAAADQVESALAAREQVFEQIAAQAQESELQRFAALESAREADKADELRAAAKNAADEREAAAARVVAAQKAAIGKTQLDELRASYDERFAIEQEARRRLSDLETIEQSLAISADVKSDLVAKIEAKKTEALESLERTKQELQTSAARSAISIDILSSVNVDGVDNLERALEEIALAAETETTEVNDAIKINAITDEQKQEQLQLIESTARELSEAARQSFAETQSDLSFSAGRFDVLADVDLEGIQDLPLALNSIQQAVRAEAAEISNALKIEAITPEDAQIQTQRLGELASELRVVAEQEFNSVQQSLRDSAIDFGSLLDFDFNIDLSSQSGSLEAGLKSLTDTFRDEVAEINAVPDITLDLAAKSRLIQEARDIKDAMEGELRVTARIAAITDGLDGAGQILGGLDAITGASADDAAARAQETADRVKETRADLAAAIESGDQREIDSQRSKLAMLEGLSKKEDAIAKRRFEQNKKVQIASAIASTISAGLKAFESAPWPTNFPAMFAALATGFAQVKTLASTQYNSTSASASGGGSGATSGSASPSQVQQANTTTTDNAPAQNGTLTIQLPRRRERWSDDEVDEIFERAEQRRQQGNYANIEWLRTGT